MGKAHGRKRRARKKFQYDKNRRKMYKKAKKKPSIGCTEMKNAWDPRKSVQANLHEMGLSYNPNITLPIDTPKNESLPSTDIEMGEDLILKEKQEKLKKNVSEPKKLHVVSALEKEANEPQPNRQRLSQPEARFCTYMMEKYKDNYKAMAKDEKNYYQETPKAIRRKINFFKTLPQYKEYLLKSTKS